MISDFAIYTVRSMSNKSKQTLTLHYFNHSFNHLMFNYIYKKQMSYLTSINIQRRT